MSHYHPNRARLWAVILLCGLLSACAQQDEHVFKLGANNWLGYQPFFTAQANGYWDTDKVTIVELGSSTEVIRALANKSLDAAALTLDEAISARARNNELQIVMVLDFSHGGDVLIVRPELESLTDLSGKTIALENTALGAVMLDAILKSAGLKETDINIRPVTYDEHANVLLNGEVDGVITFEPVRSQLLAQGYRDLFNSRAIPDTIVDVLVVPLSVAERYPERIQAVMTGYFSARKLVLAQNSTTIADIGKRTGLANDAVISGYDQLKMPGLEENKALIAQCDGGLRTTAEKLRNIMMERRIINQNVDLDNLCHPWLIHGLAL